MKKINLSKIVLFLSICIYFNFLNIKFLNSTYAITGDIFLLTPSIKELSINIEKLKIIKQDFISKAKELKEEYGDILSFMKQDLNQDDFDEIVKNLKQYLENKKNLDIELKNKIDKNEDTTNLKKQILLLRIEFYKFFLKYIQKDKKNDFINNIKFQLRSEKEGKDLFEEIIKNQNLLDQKVSYIKEKIEDHKENLISQMDIKIVQKIKSRIEEIDLNEKYDKIDKETKTKIYISFISNIKSRIEEIEKSSLVDSYKEIRINILNKMLDEIKTKIE